MRDMRPDRLAPDLLAVRFSRRQVLRRAAALGLSVPALSALLAACAGEEATPTQAPAVQPTATPTEAAAETPTAAETPAGTPTVITTPETTYSMDNPPEVFNADQASQYSGATLTYYGDSVGIGAEMDQALAGAFSEATGITINVVPKPESATENYAAYQRFFSAQSPDVDVMMIDVIWPGAFAPHLVDLSQALGEEAKAHYETIIENNTVDGKLVGMPWFGDFGMLYYRTDLLEKYGFSNPPETWDELEEMAQTILEGERGANPNFAGFVFQGNAYEGLTCNALEWLASSGGGRFIENGQVTINNPQAVEMLNKVRGWVGTIAPQGVTTYQEEDSRQVFQGGNAAFLRNWPYVYSLATGEDSPVRDMVGVAPLPAQPGNPHVGTVGGWQLAVSMYSRAPEAAIEFVRYMTSPEVQTWRAVLGSFVPTIPDVASRPEVLQAMPFLEPMEAVERVTRPSRETGERYNEVSTIVFQGVNQILTGQDAAQVLPGVAQRLQRIVG
ncbi:ABC transporter substrate-binding protein [Thermomicrobiaceae bacterium CFH 74404]|uniref:ABC transporter substrate-binding protein n=1 Tax=Thermalbibacter longus TaxID=2951981 RepID=A0AA42B9A9_9BACT|nr:ABC transporter substrate-binding protein [Thermalbibacter longus]MCM8748261.1 ABC transporter substrate-binding protein [Thermalbibacter longus]